MKGKNIVSTLFIALLGGFIALLAYNAIVKPQKEVVTVKEVPAMKYANMPPVSQEAVDLTYAAEKTIHSVVHVKTKYSRSQERYQNPLYEFFYGPQEPREMPYAMGAGSGVIVSSDGYIITNNHVIDRSSEIEVVLNDKRNFTAELVGTDPSTDIAVLKIDVENLDAVDFGNSEDLRLGEWVLAVGNPYNLTSTVTAGIISQKGRSIDILGNTPLKIESFIQTDAAVNPGNSGGALVDVQGRLVGINTAIASRTGSYAGYSFAVPTSIVMKVYKDIREFGEVQRALLGVNIMDVTAELAEKEGIDKIEGVYIAAVGDESAAMEAGLKEGDIILSIEGVDVNSVAQLQEQVSKFRPGDKIKVEYKRDNKVKETNATLTNVEGNTGVVKKADSRVLGAEFEELTSAEKEELGIGNGVRIKSLSAGKFSSAGIREGFVITKINDERINSVEGLKKAIDKIEGGVFVTGVYPNGRVAYYAFSLE